MQRNKDGPIENHGFQLKKMKGFVLLLTQTLASLSLPAWYVIFGAHLVRIILVNFEAPGKNALK